MLNVKRLSIIALFLLLVGVIGSVLTYNLIQKPELVTEEIEIKEDSFTNIEISTNDARIELIPINEPNTLVEVSGHDSKNNFSASVTESTLTIVYKDSKKKFFSFDVFPKSPTLKVYVPKKLYDTIRVQSDYGSFSAKDIDASEVNVKANDGAIELRDINAASIITESDNGQIKAENLIGTTVKVKVNDGRTTLKSITADSISIVSDNGKIRLEEINGNLSAKANDGSIKLMTKTLDFPIEFSTDNGHIDIQTDNAPINASIRAQSDNGSITIFDEKKSHSVFGSGEHEINLSTNDGKIVVAKR
ncbi:DUF4097 family beta strand repeat-containing protein [Sporosarcina limicola]|uniref:DUF4097 and DUF4098 domain-containing protein YvlB n=1 Tax=Sporosarcina limicola TaxID=34101 RepID=A0A927R3R7_9BACL|nr:DUF4097 family beta strand repeat-containing protein [Sporosarcina limicola]MBE1555391.1 DUF4097 and DUF4098 domain-containing protein YvlB [Sporosarcina limicola]